MDQYEDDDMELEIKKEVKEKNVFQLVPMARAKPKKIQPPTTYGIVNSQYEIFDKNTSTVVKEGPLIFLDRNNHERVINKFGIFYDIDWVRSMVPSRFHSLVCESVYNCNINNGYLRWIDHTPHVNMIVNGKINPNLFNETNLLNIELESGCTCLAVMPIPALKGDSLANVVEVDNELLNNNMVNILAGCEDGSVVLTEIQIPEQEDSFHEEFKDVSRFEDHEDDIVQSKGNSKNKSPPKEKLNRKAQSKGNYDYYSGGNWNSDITQASKKPKEVVYLHKDTVTSICQRPSYPFQFLTTSLDGTAILSLLSNSLTQEDLIILKFTNKICEEGIGEAAWMDQNWFIAKNDVFGQIVLQDVREGEGKFPQHLYTTPNLWKINQMDLSFPYVGLAWDDGTMSILDLRGVDIDQHNNLVPLFSVTKPGESWMWVKLLKDTIRIYGWYETGIYGYRYNDDNLSHDNIEWHGNYDSSKYGIPKSLHVIHQEKREEDGSIYCQDILCIGSYNGQYVYGLVQDDEDQS